MPLSRKMSKIDDYVPKLSILSMEEYKPSTMTIKGIISTVLNINTFESVNIKKNVNKHLF